MKLEDYSKIVGQGTIDELKILADRLQGKVIQNINSTGVGGGVAEILNRMIPFLRELGLDARWDFIKGGESFFNVTKKFHNALHGRKENIREKDFSIFTETGKINLEQMEIYGEIVFIHDPQPIFLVEKKKDSFQKWIWRCHVDVSRPNPKIWEFLMNYIRQYNAAVFSAPAFSQQLPISQFLISPSIDPLSEKNIDLSEEFVRGVLAKYGIERDRPIITQISRFDYLKDPLGVIEAYKIVKKSVDCQLILAGGTASDDPEGIEVYNKVQEAAVEDENIHILLLPQNDIEVNALQRGSDVIIQKSLKEGFGLTVTEALWKGKPVVASAVGGIPLQITHRYNGYLCHSIEGAAFGLKQFLNNPDYAKKLGENGRAHVHQNFLLTRHLRDYMLLFLSLYNSGDIIHL
ncbi:MAG: glycosyltransferase [bacterium]